MRPNSRPDGITRTQMPGSSQSNPATPIIVGFIVTLLLFFILLLFMGILPLEDLKSGHDDQQKINNAIINEENQAMKNLNNTGTLYPHESVAKPDPILTKLDTPFVAEEQKEEDQMDG